MSQLPDREVESEGSGNAVVRDGRFSMPISRHGKGGVGLIDASSFVCGLRLIGRHRHAGHGQVVGHLRTFDGFPAGVGQLQRERDRFHRGGRVRRHAENSRDAVLGLGEILGGVSLPVLARRDR